MAVPRRDYSLIFDEMQKRPEISAPELKSRLPNRHSLKTITRIRNTTEALLRLGTRTPTDEEKQKIVDENLSYYSSIRNVDTIYDHLCAWRLDELKKQELTRDHLKRLFDQVKQLRDCLEHPTLNFPEREFLTIDGWNFQLDPLSWFRFSTPDFDSDDWAPGIEYLKSHTAKCLFWDHLEQLKEATKELIGVYDTAAQQVPAEDERFKKLWTRVQVIREHDITLILFFPKKGRDERKPPFETEEIRIAISVLQEHSKVILSDKQLELEKMLDQLYHDLDLDSINDMITKRHCKKCP